MSLYFCLFNYCSISLNRLPWKDLIMPVVELCRNGFTMTHHTRKYFLSFCIQALILYVIINDCIIEIAVDVEWDKMSSSFRQIFLNSNGTRKRVSLYIVHKDHMTVV